MVSDSRVPLITTHPSIYHSTNLVPRACIAFGQRPRNGGSRKINSDQKGPQDWTPRLKVTVTPLLFTNNKMNIYFNETVDSYSNENMQTKVGKGVRVRMRKNEDGG